VIAVPEGWHLSAIQRALYIHLRALYPDVPVRWIASRVWFAPENWVNDYGRFVAYTWRQQARGKILQSASLETHRNTSSGSWIGVADPSPHRDWTSGPAITFADKATMVGFADRSANRGVAERRGFATAIGPLAQTTRLSLKKSISETFKNVPVEWTKAHRAPSWLDAQLSQWSDQWVQEAVQEERQHVHHVLERQLQIAKKRHSRHWTLTFDDPVLPWQEQARIVLDQLLQNVAETRQQKWQWSRGSVRALVQRQDRLRLQFSANVPDKQQAHIQHVAQDLLQRLIPQARIVSVF
jgi:hypothetical protein